VKGLFEKGTDLVLAVIQFLWVLAFAVFIWGIVKFIAAAGNPEKRNTAKGYIIYGLIGIFILVSFVGLIYILQNTIFQGSPSSQLPVPGQPELLEI
jgi:hypothetical protein